MTMFTKSFFQSRLPVQHHGDGDRCIAVSAGFYQEAFSGIGDGKAVPPLRHGNRKLRF